uniref:Frizzled-8 n=1 Tax=Sarcoptes scabiei TaxID=52283 RepID=A0A834R9L9_SARSC
MFALRSKPTRCERITIPMCSNIGYSKTLMPNSLEMETQQEAGLEVHQFWPLVHTNCSDDMRFFLCSIYVPICIENYHGLIESCRSVCERSRQGCRPILARAGFRWPDHLDCSRYPVYGATDRMCMDPKQPQNNSFETIISVKISVGGKKNFLGHVVHTIPSDLNEKRSDVKLYKLDWTQLWTGNNNSNNNHKNQFGLILLSDIYVNVP